MTKPDELKQAKSYRRGLASAMRILDGAPAQPIHSRLKGGGENDKKNRNHRREAPADSGKRAESLNNCLVRGVLRPGTDGDAG